MKQEMPSIVNLHKGTIRLQLVAACRLMVPLVPIPNGSLPRCDSLPFDLAGAAPAYRGFPLKPDSYNLSSPHGDPCTQIADLKFSDPQRIRQVVFSRNGIMPIHTV